MKAGMRAADDFEAIRENMRAMRPYPYLHDTCPGHVFPDGQSGRCSNCGLHYFHLPALARSEPAPLPENVDPEVWKGMPY